MKKLLLLITIINITALTSCSAQNNIGSLPPIVTPLSSDKVPLWQPTHGAGPQYTFGWRVDSIGDAVGRRLGITAGRIPIGAGVGVKYTNTGNFGYDVLTNSFGFGSISRISGYFDNTGRTWYILDDISGTPRGIIYNGISAASPLTYCNGFGMDYQGRSVSTGVFYMGSLSGANVSIDNATNTFSVTASAAVSFNGLKLPLTDGTPGQAITTDGSYNLGWSSITATSSGTYVPTVISSSNVDATIMLPFYWSKVGDVVNVTGMISIDPTITLTNTNVIIDLPIASNATHYYDLAGLISSGYDGGGAVVSQAAGSPGGATLFLNPVTTMATIFMVSFSYPIIP